MTDYKLDKDKKDELVKAVEEGYKELMSLGFSPIPRNVFDWKKFLCDKLFPSDCNECGHNDVCGMKNDKGFHCNHFIDVRDTVKSMLWQLPSDWKQQTYYEDHAVIRDATCSSCGYTHPDAHIHSKRVQTVKPDDIVNAMFRFCPRCGRESGGYIGV